MRTGMNEKTMVFVREKTTCKFLDENGALIVPFSKALTFGSIPAAINFCFKKSVRDVQIVIRMDDPPYDLVLDIN